VEEHQKKPKMLTKKDKEVAGGVQKGPEYARERNQPREGVKPEWVGHSETEGLVSKGEEKVLPQCTVGDPISPGRKGVYRQRGP